MKEPAEFTPEDRLASGLIRKIAAGNSSSLASLYNLYHQSLFSFIRTIVRENGAAEEILQDVFVRTYEQATRYDPELGSPFVWMATISKRMSIDWLRKHNRRPQFVANRGEHPAEFEDKSIHEYEQGAHHTLEASWVLETLEQLPPGQREALELAFLQGLRHREIAEALGKPLGSVKSDLRRGLMRLRNLYLGEDDRH